MDTTSSLVGKIEQLIPDTTTQSKQLLKQVEIMLRTQSTLVKELDAVDDSLKRLEGLLSDCRDVARDLKVDRDWYFSILQRFAAPGVPNPWDELGEAVDQGLQEVDI